ncbi:MAG: hypothetical protein KAJ51_11290 [Thermoplasmata archaeon]|nr:hypothetical protein [Thermoplasmata archaeon]
MEVSQDFERTHCNFCGTELVIGVKSTRDDINLPKTVFCTSCGKDLSPAKGDLIFHCTKCNEPVCEVCNTVRDDNKYCRKCA